MAPSPRSEQRGRWRNEAGGGLSAPGPHGQRTGVQGGGRVASGREGISREEREKACSAGRTGRKKVSIP